MRVVGATLVAVAVVLVATGCGGSTLHRHDLQKSTEAIQSLAAEGALLAARVAEGEGTEVFTRVHSLYLEKAAAKVQRKLLRARTAPSLAPKRRSATRVAAEVGRALELLHESPGDRAIAKRVQVRLAHAAADAERLGK